MSETVFQDERVLGQRYRIKVTEKVLTHDLPTGLAKKPILKSRRNTYFDGEGMTFDAAKQRATLINRKYPVLKRLFGGYGAKVVRETY